eukprot:4832380-Pyramimonas_sp.AAC.1
MKLHMGRDPCEAVAELIATFAATAADGNDGPPAACSSQRSTRGCERKKAGWAGKGGRRRAVQRMEHEAH